MAGTYADLAKFTYDGLSLGGGRSYDDLTTLSPGSVGPAIMSLSIQAPDVGGDGSAATVILGLQLTTDTPSGTGLAHAEPDEAEMELEVQDPSILRFSRRESATYRSRRS